MRVGTKGERMEDVRIQPVQAADAQVLENDLMIPSGSFEVDMSGIQRDIEELTAAIDEALTVYGSLLVEPSDIERMPYADVRKCERSVSAAIREADDLRKKLNRDYKTPLDIAKRRYDELMGPVIELHGLFKARRMVLDEAQKEEKKQAICDLYLRMAPFIALPLEGQDEALVPFERVYDLFGSKWLNKGASLDGIELELGGIVRRIAEGEQRIDEAGLSHAGEAKALYWQTLDLDAAFAHDERLCRAEQRQAALEARRVKFEEAARASLDEGAVQNSAEPQAQQDPNLVQAQSQGPTASDLASPRSPRVMLIDGATDDECRQIGAFCKSLGISGVFKGPAFHEAVQALLE